MAGATTILEREVLRGQRRWQTFAFRAGFTAAMFVVFAVSYRDVTRWYEWGDPADLAYIGERLFEGAMYAQWWLLGLLTPILVAQGIVEEKNQGTLDLLAISKLKPHQLLGGKVLSSLSHLGLLLLAGMPIIALTLAFGGVSPGSFFIAYATTAVAVLSLASLAAFFALFARGPLGPLVLSWTVAFIAWMVLPLPGILALDDEDAFGWSSLAYAFFQGIDHPSVWMLWPCVVWIVLSMVILQLAGQVFSALLASQHGEDAEAALLSVEIWAIERLRRRQGLRVAILLFTSPVLALSNSLGHPFWLVIPSFVWSLVGLYTALITILLVSRTVLLKVAGFQGKRALSKAEKAAIVAGPRGAGQRPAGSREVWGNPVAWREIVTRSHGVLTIVAGRAYVLVLLLLGVLIVFREGLSVDPEFFSLAAGFGFVATAGMAVLVATSSMVGEQRRGTLALLCVTPMGAGRILRGKLTALFVYLAPPFAISTICWLMGVSWFVTRRSAWDGSASDLAEMGVRTLSTMWIAFAAAAFLGSASLWIAARMKTPTRAWMGTLGMSAFLALAPLLALALSRGRGLVRDAVVLINPVLNEDFWRHRTPDGVWLSGLMWVTLAALLFWHNARTLSRVAR